MQRYYSVIGKIDHLLQQYCSHCYTYLVVIVNSVVLVWLASCHNTYTNTEWCRCIEHNTFKYKQQTRIKKWNADRNLSYILLITYNRNYKYWVMNKVVHGAYTVAV